MSLNMEFSTQFRQTVQQVLIITHRGVGFIIYFFQLRSPDTYFHNFFSRLSDKNCTCTKN